MRTIRLISLAVALAAMSAYGQPFGGPGGPLGRGGDRPAPPPTRPSVAGAQAAGAIRVGDLRLDIASRQIIINSTVCLQEGPLELLLCGWQTKEYESVLHSRGRGAELHAALLALGLTPGLPARYAQAEEDEQGRFIPPQGPLLHIALRYPVVWDLPGRQRLDELLAAGEIAPAESAVAQAARRRMPLWVQEVDASSVIAPAGQDKTPPPRLWVFVGSQVLPDNRYWADVDGDIISVSNFPSAVIDVPFESSNKNELRQYVARAELIPPVDTPVEIVITPVADAAVSPYARAMVEVDRFGRFSVEGQALKDEELRDWARTFVAQHPKAQVLVRVDPLALAWDIQRAKIQLRLGGIRDTEQEIIEPRQEPLPRTVQQEQAALADWAEQFASAADMVRDPFEEARRLLGRIDQEVQALESLKALWTTYARDLRKLAAQYPSTAPAGGPAKPPQ